MTIHPTDPAPPQHRVTLVAATLADGRDIFYFDERPHPDRVLDDPRELPPVLQRPEIRYDALQDEWVGIAGHRQARTHHPPADACPLCPSTSTHPSEVPSPDYDVVVFENRFPSFAGTGESTCDGAPFDSRPGNGRCEVVCFTDDHYTSLAALAPARVRTVIEAWTARTAALSAQPGIEQVFCFENRGAEIGVTLAHPHGQIYGYPFVTPKTATEIRSARAHRERTGTNLFGDLLGGEIANAKRIVSRNAHWLAFVPFAARWPFEIHLYPFRQVADLTELNDAERDALADLYHDVLQQMDGLFTDTMPAITGVHQAPVRTGRADYWLHLQVFSIRRAEGKLKYLAGSESAMGAYVNDVQPETAAQRLRNAHP